MYIKFLNNNGGGFAENIELDEGTNLEAFLNKYAKDNNIASSDEDSDGSFNLKDWNIRVNRDIVARHYILKDGDRVTMTPARVKGA